nr:zinc-ribbon domain-containing protein [Candidatus Sigynarchaeota archaeon]
MSDTCPYCGRSIKRTDRFCISCGEPLLRQEEPEENGATSIDAGSQANDKASVGSDSGVIPDDEIPIKIKKKEEIKGETIQDAKVSAGLDPDVKRHIEATIELYRLATVIKKYKARLDESLKLMEDPDFRKKYDFDEEFQKTNAIRLEALKQMGEELRKKKKEQEAKLQPKFVLEENNKRIKTLKVQIEELVNSFKLRRIDRKTYDALHTEYMIELKRLMADRDVANIQLRAWIKTLKMEQEDLKLKLNVAKGRKASKEISKEELQETKEQLDKDFKKIGESIRVIEQFIFED